LAISIKAYFPAKQVNKCNKEMSDFGKIVKLFVKGDFPSRIFSIMKLDPFFMV